jgi:hypothetical protein
MYAYLYSVHSCISVVSMTGAALVINDVSLADSILSLKQRIFDLNPKMSIHRQRLMFPNGPHGMGSLADNETLGGAGVAQDGSANIDVLLADRSTAEIAELGAEVDDLRSK